MKRQYIAQDQFGNTFFLYRHPRKELLAILGRKSASKMYRDTSEGVMHVGYVIGQHWVEVMGLEGVTFAKHG